MTRITLAAVLSVGLSGFAAAPGTREGCVPTRCPPPAAGEPRAAVTAIKAIVNHSRFRVEARNTENPNKELNGANVSPAAPPRAVQHRVDMWIPWARSSSEFRTHHISVTLRDEGGRAVREFTIWQRADFDGDWVRVGEDPHPGDGVVESYAEPGTHIPGAPLPGGDRMLVVSASGDLSLNGVP